MPTSILRALIIVAGVLVLLTVIPVAATNAQTIIVRGYAECPRERFEVSDNAHTDCQKKAREAFIRSFQPPAAPRGTKSFTINPIARTTTTSRSVWFHPKLQVLVVNINPYLYEYKVDVASERISEPALYLFFKALLPGLPSPKDFGDAVGAVKLFDLQMALENSEKAQRKTGTCRPAERRRVRELLESGDALTAPLTELEEGIRLLGGIEAEIVANRGVWSNSASETPRVIDAALATIDALQDYAGGAPAIVNADAVLKPRINAWLVEAKVALNCGDDSDDLASMVGGLRSRYKIASDLVTTIDPAKIAKETKKEADFLAAPLREPTSFFQETVLDVGSATVKVTVQRRGILAERLEDSKKPPFVTAMTATTGVGLPRIFSLAVGMTAFADTVHSYQVTKVYSGSLAGGDSVTSVITELTTEKRRVSPLFLLDTRLPILDGYASSLWSGLGLQIGATVAKDVTTNMEYVVGVSSHFIDDRVFVGWANYAAKEQALVTGFRTGSRLPSAQSTIPTVTRTRWHDVWILSFRLY